MENLYSQRVSIERNLPKITLLAFLGFLLISFSVSAQDAVPKGHFHAGEVKLGEPVVYSLVFRHASTLEVVFPDSTYDFAPFELLKKEYFPTKTNSLGSYDSVAYTLATYELDKIQYLAMPIFLPSDNPDEYKKVFSDKDSVLLVEIIKEIPAERTAFEDTSIVNVAKEFNYPYLLIGLTILFLLTIVLFFAFGGKVRNYFRKKKLQKAHQRFNTDFDKLATTKSNRELDKPTALWKKYTGNLMNVPMQSYTTTEIDKFIADPSLVKSLRNIDRVFYSGNETEDVKKEFAVLKEFSQQEYEKLLQKEFGKNK